MRAGFRYVRQHRRIFELILLGTLFWAAAGIVVTAVAPFTVTVDTACAGVSGCVKVTVAYQYANNRILPVLPLISWVPGTLTAFAVAPK